MGITLLFFDEKMLGKFNLSKFGLEGRYRYDLSWGLISSGDRTQTVMVVTTVNPKIFVGNLYLNSTPSIKFYFPALQAISEFTASLEGPVRQAFQCIDTKKGIKKGIRLNRKAKQTRITEWLGLLMSCNNGWSFVSCTGCSRKLDKDETSLRCIRYVNPNATGINGGGSVELPQCLKDLGGQDFVFQLRVTPFNFTPSHRGEASATGSNMTGGEEKEPNPSDAGGKGSSRKRLRE
ncbi:hypothetical protein IGI04_035770 [Brassica rapa subsp. trilocularis]|uniref:Uncharacterized protein n=1 Tax=Brassica rapa subsp. trilocularis TaxID=1813537 RepID=A0ABQ7LCJ8_BRACM|nr:hypothetical protein IGI04_035770 [Brassica rapa subsp. trilocularis]